MSTDSTNAGPWVEMHLAGWPAARQKLAAELIGRYGRPHQVTSTELIWGAVHPWKRIVLHRTGAKHNFPLPHEDVLEQTVNYKVPPKKAAALLSYNGSLIIDHTSGELSAHCDSEPQNRIALNLADDIVTGNRDVDEALGYHAQMVRALETHVSESYPQELKFKILPSSQTADPGEIAPLLEHLGQ